MRETMVKAGVSDFIQLKILSSGFCSCFHDHASQLFPEAGLGWVRSLSKAHFKFKSYNWMINSFNFLSSFQIFFF